MHPDAITLAGLVAVPTLGIASGVLLALLLKRRWLPDSDLATAGTLSAVVVMAAFLACVHAVAFGRMLGLLGGLSIPGIALGFTGLLAFCGVVLTRRAPERDQTPPQAPRLRAHRRTDWLCLVPIVLLHALLLIEALSRTPTGHDALKYHLPMAVLWIRADALVMKPYTWMFSLPANGELASWWLLKGGFEHVASVAYWPAGLLLAGAAWSIVRVQRGSRFAGIVAVAIILSTYLVVREMYTSYIDVFGTAFLAAGILALLLAGSPHRPRAARRLLVVIAGLGIGIALGTKPVNWPYGLVVAVLFLIMHLYRRRRDRDLLFLVPAFGLTCALCSAFWFARAAIETGNPFYPMRVAIGDRTLLRGVDIGWSGRDPTLPLLGSVAGTAKLLGRLPRSAATLDPDPDTGGVGPLFSTFVPVCMAAAIALVIVRRRRETRHERGTVLLLTVAIFVAWVLAIRCHGRYGIIYLVLGTCLAAPLLGRVARVWPRPVHALALAVTCLACTSVAIVPAQELYRRVAEGDFSRARYYCIPRLIDELPAGTRIINLSKPGALYVNYALYGEGLKNDVIDTMTTQAMFPDLSPTLEQLQALGVDYVFVREPFRTDWPDAARIELIYDDQHAARPPGVPAHQIYRVSSTAWALGCTSYIDVHDSCRRETVEVRGRGVAVGADVLAVDQVP